MNKKDVVMQPPGNFALLVGDIIGELNTKKKDVYAPQMPLNWNSFQGTGNKKRFSICGIRGQLVQPNEWNRERATTRHWNLPVDTEMQLWVNPFPPNVYIC